MGAEQEDTKTHQEEEKANHKHRHILMDVLCLIVGHMESHAIYITVAKVVHAKMRGTKKRQLLETGWEVATSSNNHENDSLGVQQN